MHRILRLLLLGTIIAAVVFLSHNSPHQWEEPPAVYSSISALEQRPDRHSLSQGVLSQAWAFDSESDATNYGLSEEQCALAFPQLYFEVDRAVSFWRKINHTITPDDIGISWRSDGAFRVLIHDNKLRVLETRIFETKQAYGNHTHRASAVLNQLNRALIGATSTRETFRAMEFSVVVDDLSLIPNRENDTHTVMHFARRIIDTDQDRIWLIPDFNFWSAPAAGGIVEYEEARQLAKQHDSLLVNKTPRAVWRGALWTNRELRGALLNATANKPWADVMEIDWTNQENMIRTEDICDYMFLLHTEGQSWSGRLKYLLNCNSLVLVHDLEWRTHFYHLLVSSGPDQNYIPLKRDFSNLEEKVSWLLDNPNYAQQVADNAVVTFRKRYTTPAAAACYWRQLLRSWNTVAFTPDPYEKENELGQRGLRGIAWEDFL
ncbi:hypothetical protein SCARD494_09369 [Seiridium cardinale]